MKEQAPKVSPLRRLRFEAGDLSLSEVSEISAREGRQIDRSLLSRIEKGLRSMSYEHALSLASVYHVAPGNLLKEMADWYDSRRAATKKRRAASAQPERAA